MAEMTPIGNPEDSLTTFQALGVVSIAQSEQRLTHHLRSSTDQTDIAGKTESAGPQGSDDPNDENGPPDGPFRHPVLLLFVRGKAGGKQAEHAKELKEGWAFHDEMSARFIDLMYVGWYENNGEFLFDESAYLRCIREVQQRAPYWEPPSVSRFLLAYKEIRRGCSRLRFDNAIDIDVADMLHKSEIDSLDRFLGDLITLARRYADNENADVVDTVSNTYGLRRGSRWLVDWITSGYVHGATNALSSVARFATRNFEPTNPPNDLQYPITILYAGNEGFQVCEKEDDIARMLGSYDSEDPSGNLRVVDALGREVGVRVEQRKLQRVALKA